MHLVEWNEPAGLPGRSYLLFISLQRHQSGRVQKNADGFRSWPSALSDRLTAVCTLERCSVDKRRLFSCHSLWLMPPPLLSSERHCVRVSLPPAGTYCSLHPLPQALTTSLPRPSASVCFVCVTILCSILKVRHPRLQA